MWKVLGNLFEKVIRYDIIYFFFFGLLKIYDFMCKVWIKLNKIFVVGSMEYVWFII